MPNAMLPVPAPIEGPLPDSPLEVVEAFLAALAANDTATAMRLIDDDIMYINVSVATVRGRDQFARVVALLDHPKTGFEVVLHSISAEGGTVLSERTDVLIHGRFRSQFWVWGRFDVHRGKIVLWRDSFDFIDVVRGTMRGLVALVLPSSAPTLPTAEDASPGR